MIPLCGTSIYSMSRKLLVSYLRSTSKKKLFSLSLSLFLSWQRGERELPSNLRTITVYREETLLLHRQSADPQERKQYFPVASLPSVPPLTVPWNFSSSAGKGGGKKERKDERRRIICRRDIANQFAIKFRRHVRKTASASHRTGRIARDARHWE